MFFDFCVTLPGDTPIRGRLRLGKVGVRRAPGFHPTAAGVSFFWFFSGSLENIIEPNNSNSPSGYAVDPANTSADDLQNRQWPPVPALLQDLAPDLAYCPPLQAPPRDDVHAPARGGPAYPNVEAHNESHSEVFYDEPEDHMAPPTSSSSSLSTEMEARPVYRLHEHITTSGDEK